MERLKLFKDGESIAEMKDLGTTKGVEISSYATDIITEDELYTSLYTLTFRYSEGLPYLADLKRNNFVRSYSNGRYNLYVINEVDFDTVDSVTEVHCIHYTTLFAGEAVPDLTLFGRGQLTVQGVINRLNSSHYKSPHYDIRLDSNSEDTDVVDLTGHTFGNSTMGQMWTGSNSVLREYYGVLIVRDLNGITIINPSSQNVKSLPLVLGINIKGLNYKLEEPERYTTAMVNLNSIPSIDVQGTGLDDTSKVYEGIANTNLTTFDQMDDGDEIQVFYKGLLIRILKTGGSLYTEPYSDPKLISNTDSMGIEPLFHQNNRTSFNGTRLVVIQGDAGNEVTLLDEDIDPTYLVGYRAYVNYQNVTADPHGQIGTQKYLGFTPKPSNGVGSGDLDVIFSKINKELYKVPVNNPNYDGHGSNVYLVDYPEPEQDKVRTKDNPRGFTEAYHFYRWYFQGYRGFWDSKEAKKLNQPKFKAVVEVDALTSIFGESYYNNTIFRLGDRYQVRASKQGLEFESEVTTVTYSVSDDELISVEFGNFQDFEVEQVKNNNLNGEQARRVYSKQTSTGGVVTKRPTQSSSGGGGGGFNKDDADKWLDEVIKDGELDDELGEWLDDVLNGDDIRDEKDLFEGDLPYIKRTDDTGIPKMEWEPPYVTISPDGKETTPTKLVCYNGAESVIGEVRFKGGISYVEVRSDGSFRNGRDSLPDNTGFTIVPYPEGTSSTRSWTPVFTTDNTEGFNKDTEHGISPYRDRDLSTPEDIALAKEDLGYKYHFAFNFTTKGTIKFETEKLMFNRYINEFSKTIGSYGLYGLKNMYQIKDKAEFKREIVDRLQGQTVKDGQYNPDLAPDVQSLAYYLKQVEEGEQSYLKSVYRELLKQILYKVAYTRSDETTGVTSFGDILKVTFENTDEEVGIVLRHKRIIDVEFDEDALGQLDLRAGPFIKEEPGWNILIFTKPTTKVNDQTVRVNHLLITNGGTSTKNALISKQSVDDLWEQLTSEERKEFEDIYGKEWLFNLKNTPDQYDSDEVLFGAFYRVKNKIKPPGAIDPFGPNARLVRQDEERAKRISERYQQKYNFLTSKGYTVPPSHSGQVTYDRVEKHYLEQASIE